MGAAVAAAFSGADLGFTTGALLLLVAARERAAPARADGVGVGTTAAEGGGSGGTSDGGALELAGVN